jgi:Family of unknown function (DUF6029)
MKKTLIALLLIISINLLIAEFNFSGSNEFMYIRSNRQDKGKDYFSDKFQFQAQYNSFRTGMKYDFYRPKFDKFAVNIEENENYVDEYYLQYESDYWFVQAGTFEAVIGSGMVLHNFYDDDFDIDSRLIGGYANPYYDKWQLQMFGGLMESANSDPTFEDEYDQLGALDIDLSLIDNFSFGGSYVLHKELINVENDEFLKRTVFAGKLNYSSSLFDLNSEIASSTNDNDLEGTAIYSNLTTYLGNFTMKAAYKKYENFDVRISDLPMVNHIGQQLEHSWDPGKDEEGVMGEIRFLPNYEDEFVVNYAEGWDSSDMVNLSNLYTEFKHDFENWSFKAEYESLEQLNKYAHNWYKELTPILTFDFMINNNPVLIKAEYQYKERDKLAGGQSHYEPRFQTDFGFGNISISAAVETQLGDSNEFEDGDDGDMWIGGELAVTIPEEVNIGSLIFNNIMHSTDIRLFAGKEKGGIVCRNGVCKNQAEFDGIRLSITTTF